MRLPEWAFLRKDFLTERSYPVDLGLRLFGLTLNILFWFFIGKWVDRLTAPRAPSGYFAFVLIGLAVVTLESTALNAFSMRVREAQLAGTLEILLLTPRHPMRLLLDMGLWDILTGALYASLYLVLGSFLAPIEWSWQAVRWMLGILFLYAVATATLGLFAAALIIWAKRGNPIAWAVSILTALLSGAFYPISVLPDPLPYLSFLLPATHAIRLLRSILLPQPYGPLPYNSLFFLAGLLSVGLPAGALALRLSLNRARHKGTLAHY